MRFSVACLVAALGVSSAQAADITLSFTADGSSRWYDYFSDAFGQLNQGFNGSQTIDGFFLISALPSFQQVGDGADIFPFEADFDNIGSVTYDGTGNGTFPISDLELDFSPFVADNDDLLSAGYATEITSLNGTVTVTNGAIASIDGSFGIRFIYDAREDYGRFLNYDGTLTFAGANFALNVDDSETIDGFAPFRTRWDVTGTVDNIGQAVGAAGQFSFVEELVELGEDCGVVQVEVERTGGSAGAVSVNLATMRGTALPSDYAVNSGTLSWADGETAPQSFAVVLRDDSLIEGEEAFEIVMTNPTGGAQLGMEDAALIVILDDDDLIFDSAFEGVSRYACVVL